MKYFLPIFSFVIFLITGCSPEKSEFGEETVENMAMSDKVQVLFSEGRKQVVLQSEEAKQQILQNNLIEQESILNDPTLREEYLNIMMSANDMIAQDEKGMEKLKQQMITVMDDIQQDKKQNIKLVEGSLASRKRAIEAGDKLKTNILKQNVAEEELRLHHPATNQKVKELSLTLNKLLLDDPKFSKKMMEQNVILLQQIAQSPSSRSKMADAMLLIMKDPKIQAEMKLMITQAVAQAGQKLKREMTQEMKKLKQEMMALKQQLERTEINDIIKEKPKP
ncbi:MAG TPA: hypothetical protein VIG73_11800 [Cerasibacillus sp.]|uniref:hypothetical protein n=1 Tax=Cerasibacillus sp. TaxID=2498711 RepID=UPI002F3FE7FE